MGFNINLSPTISDGIFREPTEEGSFVSRTSPSYQHHRVINTRHFFSTSKLLLAVRNLLKLMRFGDDVFENKTTT